MPLLKASLSREELLCFTSFIFSAYRNASYPLTVVHKWNRSVHPMGMPDHRYATPSFPYVHRSFIPDPSFVSVLLIPYASPLRILFGAHLQLVNYESSRYTDMYSLIRLEPF